MEFHSIISIHRDEFTQSYQTIEEPIVSQVVVLYRLATGAKQKGWRRFFGVTSLDDMEKVHDIHFRSFENIPYADIDVCLPTSSTPPHRILSTLLVMAFFFGLFSTVGLIGFEVLEGDAVTMAGEMSFTSPAESIVQAITGTMHDLVGHNEALNGTG